MAQLPRIPEINIARLNNSEYLYFLLQVIAFARIATAQSIGVSDTLLIELEEYLDKMVAISTVTHSSEHTALLQDLDTKRKDLLSHILGSIRTARKVSIENMKHAGNSLYLSTKKYIGTQSLPHNQETQQIFNLQKDLEDAESTAHILTLGLTSFVSELFKINHEYFEHAKERTADTAEKDLGSCKDVRLLTDERYDYLTTMAGAAALMTPSDEVMHFVESLNILIKETNTSYNQRTAQHKTPSTDEVDEITE